MAGEKRDGRQDRWSKHNEQRRRQIIDAAIEAIEASEPAADVQVQQIASRAGLSRTVVYRHFEDRADLDRAVQQAILDGLWSELIPAITLDGTAPEIIQRVIGTYVRWARAHPALHLAADHDIDGGNDGPFQQGMEQLAGRISTIVGTAVVALGATPSEEEAEALDPLIYGLVGAVFGAVRRWLTRPGERLEAETLERLTAQSIWYVIDGHARGFGIELDPDMPLDTVLSEGILAG
ncbi:TetR/AcrR family transcriptional regulator [Nocardioides albertanoniae]|uniref:TetR/AcrR family transcriptional regulator n=1 Tax=Nocardioides albertanoniae TaxID=1175486 RepID=UPI00114FAE85|nr:TetR/AcrR family transcriptional regulator [Nocardioides albertanoniae]